MQSIFSPSTRAEIISRIQSLNEVSPRQWGKMNVFQMAQHCVRCEELYLGKMQTKRSFLGRIFGKMGLKQLLKDQPFKQNEPTSPLFVVKETQGDLEAEKAKWIALLKEYEHYDQPVFVHWFFGEMTKEQVGQFVYKHNDHHLRQFNT